MESARGGTLNKISASVTLAATLLLSANSTFSLYRSSVTDGSTTVPTFSLIGSVGVTVTTSGLGGTFFSANSTVTIQDGDLLAMVVSVNTLFSFLLSNISFDAGLSIL